jgi:Na+-translocating ferredoxin:NAD+ oxidoreductase RnfC subunit
MHNFADEIIEALIALKDEFRIPRIVIGTKKKFVREIAALKNAIASHGADIEIITVSSFYPAGDEQVLLYEVTGETVPPGGIPPMLNIAVINVTTALNIRYAIDAIAWTRRYVTVNGAVGQPIIVDAPVGARLSDVIKAAGGACAEPYTVIKGGPMMGAQFPQEESENLVLGKADGGIIVLPESHPLIQY